MSQEKLREIQTKAGAILTEDAKVPVSFGNDRAGLNAATTAVVLCDRSNWGLIKLTGDDRLRFLHNQTTNNIESLKSGSGCDTIFVNSTGRTIDLAAVYLTEDAILVLVSPNRRQQLMQWMDRYLFPMDKVELADISDSFAIFTLIGPQSDDIVQKLSLETILGQPEASHSQIEIGDVLLTVAVGNGLGLAGYNFIVPIDKSAEIWSKITEAGAKPIGDRVWEQLRVIQGRPASDRELTEEYNPLEAGLMGAISFEKGCYIGQETIARLNTYQGVKQRLWGVKLDREISPGAIVTLEEAKVGKLTSIAEIEDGVFRGLVYVKTKAATAGQKVTVGETSAELISLPFLNHEYYKPS